jgi:hypothetical protein
MESPHWLEAPEQSTITALKLLTELQMACKSVCVNCLGPSIALVLPKGLLGFWSGATVASHLAVVLVEEDVIRKWTMLSCVTRPRNRYSARKH